MGFAKKRDYGDYCSGDCGNGYIYDGLRGICWLLLLISNAHKIYRIRFASFPYKKHVLVYYRKGFFWCNLSERFINHPKTLLAMKG